ncbi:TPA: hypothetical protein L6B19_32670 [Pseudomonas aeruginosa]|uniref:uracil-DNA glycosylase family protein n=1 Tax=Metapseudomonas otitidis TaxID=319939 RepID=UPI0009A3E68C|nr:hypothetical protein [Pseudomonas aeruginosa]RUJ25466.1 hypothetical protein IPC380_10090 [Pseudomonas aeruginosa]RUJ43508.1 hypothetical protein IPC369_12060 [Pseudomonas aeruginosa]TEG31609.1 hypothetical protein IPC1342_19590 [Pseudomonas aeruginosa]TRO96996.1 hypothetical protein FNL71_34030 [Pseudomonas aeruginosa]
MAPPSCASHPFRKRAMPTLDAFLTVVRACTRCAPHLPHGVQPVFQFHPSAPILIAGQAPGARVHASGVPFDDASGARLRAWLGVDRDTFYDPTRIAILPMGFCYPGTGKSGDLPLRPECAPRLARSLHAAFRAPVAGHRAGQLRHGLPPRYWQDAAHPGGRSLARALAASVPPASP